VKTKVLEQYRDVIVILLLTVVGYGDIVTDMLSISVFYQNQDYPLVALLIALLCLHIVLCLVYAKDFKNKVMALMLLKPIFDAIQIILDREQTSEYTALKKMDAIGRSIPSAALQLYGLFKSFYLFSRRSHAIILVSVSIAMVGSVMSLTGSSKTSGTKVISFRVVINFLFFTAEVIGRVVTFALMLTCIDAIVIVVLVFDFMLRWSCYTEGTFSVNSIPAVLVWMATDTGHKEDAANIVFAFPLSTIESLIFLVVLFTYNTERLVSLADYGIRKIIVVIICIAWFVKVVTWSYIINSKYMKSKDYDRNSEQRNEEVDLSSFYYLDYYFCCGCTLPSIDDGRTGSVEIISVQGNIVLDSSKV